MVLLLGVVAAMCSVKFACAISETMVVSQMELQDNNQTQFKFTAEAVLVIITM